MIAFLLSMGARVGLSPFLVKAILVTILAAMVGLFVWSWDARGRKVAELRQEIATMKDQLVVERANTAIAHAGTETIIERNAERNPVANQVAAITEGAKNANPTTDAPLSPVLRNALASIGALDRVRRETPNAATPQRPNAPRTNPIMRGRADPAPGVNRNPERRSDLSVRPIRELGELFRKPFRRASFSIASQSDNGQSQ